MKITEEQFQKVLAYSAVIFAFVAFAVPIGLKVWQSVLGCTC